MKNLYSIILFILVPIILINSGCQTKEIMLPTKISSPGDEALKHLNNWDTEELDALECLADHLYYRVGGDTNVHVETYKQKIQNLALNVRWDCKKKLYDIVSDSESSSPICGCQPKETPSSLTTLSPSDAVLFSLNSWQSEELDAVECHVNYPSSNPDVVTDSHIEIFKSQLQKLGLQARWDCKKKLYEIVPDGESSSPLCGCQPLETPLPTAAPSP